MSSSSGNDAFTSDLLSREVLRATSLHPIKQSPYQYRLHNFINMRNIIDLRQRYLTLKREMFKLRREILLLDDSNNDTKFDNITNLNSSLIELNISSAAKTTTDYEIESLFENYILNKNQDLSLDSVSNRFNLLPNFRNLKTPLKREHRHDFEFFTRSLFSPTYISPKRGLEGYWKRSLTESVRQIMDEINKNSIERGRLIDFKDIMYGYARHHPLIGVDYVIDILLVYRKYEGRKMTVPVRRHAYVRNTYTTMLFREDNLEDSEFIQLSSPNSTVNINNNDDTNNIDNTKNDNNKSIFKRFIEFSFPFLFDNSNNMNYDNNSQLPKSQFENEEMNKNLVRFKSNNQNQNFFINKKLSMKIINFVLPLTGRWDIFKRFMENFESVCLNNPNEENVRLAIVLFENEQNLQLISDETLTQTNTAKFRQSELIKIMFAKLKQNYPNKIKENTLNLIINSGNFSRSIGCEQGAGVFAIDELIFFIDVDVVFTHDFLLRTRLNTIQYKQVYYPIVFSEYDPDDIIDAIKFLTNKTDDSVKLKHKQRIKKNHFDYGVEDGYWRQFGFGIVSVYNSDLRLVGGFDVNIGKI